MGDDSAIDYSGNDEWDDFDDSYDFLSENEKNFLEASEINDTTISQFDSFFTSILTGVTTSHNLKKKTDLLVEESAKSDFMKTETIHEDMIIYAKKMGKANNTVSDLVLRLKEHCEENDIFWHNCSLRIYKKHFNNLKDLFTLKFGAEDIDFLKNEYLHFFSDDFAELNSVHSAIAPYDNKLKMVNYWPSLKVDVLEDFSSITQRKLDFIAEEIQNEGYSVIANKTKKGIKISIIKIPEAKISDISDEPLEISNLPAFNLEERYELFSRLGFEKVFTKLDTAQKNKNMMLALIMGCSVDNARKLLNRNYKEHEAKEKIKLRKAEIIERINDFLFRNKINL